MALKKRRTEEIAKKSYDWFEKNVRAMMSSEFLSSVGISSESLNNQRKINMDLYQGTMGVPSTFATQSEAGKADTNNSVTGISLDSLSKIEYKSSANPSSKVGMGIRKQIEDLNKIHYYNPEGMRIKAPSTFLTNDPHYSEPDTYGYDPYKVEDTCEKRKEPWSKK